MGDPTTLAWLTTGAFVVSSLLCLLYARCREPLKGHRIFWATLATALLLLGINKQLDLHWLLKLAVKDLAIKQGWYAHRRIIEMLFVAGMAAISLAVIVFLARAMRHTWRQRWLAFCGIVLLVAFVFVRATIIHEVYEAVKLQPPAHWFRAMLECSGVLCIGLAAALGMVNYYKKTKHQVW
jgi:hypothetical protein